MGIIANFTGKPRGLNETKDIKMSANIKAQQKKVTEYCSSAWVKKTTLSGIWRLGEPLNVLLF